MKFASSVAITLAALGQYAQAQSSVDFLQAARASVDVMGQDIGRIASGGLSQSDAIAAAHDIVSQLNNQTGSFDSARKVLPPKPTTIMCADIITAFDQYTFQFNGEAVPLGAISQTQAMNTPGTGTDGGDQDIGQDVFKALGRLQQSIGVAPNNPPQGNGFVQALNRACSSIQQQADTNSHAGTVAAAIAGDLTAYAP